MLFDDVLQCAIPTYFFSFSMFFILVYNSLVLAKETYIEYTGMLVILFEKVPV